MPNPLSPQEKLALIKKVTKEGVSITDACKEFGVSRFTFYKWYDRYKKAGPRRKAQALKSRRPKGENHWKATSPILRRKIIQLAKENPTHSVHQLAKIAPTVGNTAIQRILEKNGLNTIEQRRQYQQEFKEGRVAEPSQYRYIPNSPQKRLALIKRVLNEGAPVTEACNEFGVSRYTFYKWLKRYKENGRAFLALESNRPKGDEHWKTIAPQEENKVIELVIKHPEHSVHQLVKLLPTLGNTAIQKVLKKNGLNTHEKRTVFSQQIKKGALDYPLSWSTKLNFFFGNLPPFINNQITRFFLNSIFPRSLTILSIILTALLIKTIAKIILTTPEQSPAGLSFAIVSLIIGSVFLLYSFKYYLSLALVLSSSRREASSDDPANSRPLRGKLSGLVNGTNVFSRLFRMSNPVVKTHIRSSHEEQFGTGARGIFSWLFGLKADGRSQDNNAILINGEIGRLELERKPFISIHLPMFNEKRVAKRLIESCANMDYLDENGLPNYEILVCDDSTDETVEIVQQLAEEINEIWRGKVAEEKAIGKSAVGGPPAFVRVLHRPTREGFKGGALKYALEKVDPRTEFIMVFDADFVPFPDTIEQFLKHFQFVCQGLSRTKIRKSKVAAVTGYQWHVLNKDENWITKGVRTEYSGSYLIERPARELTGGFKIIHGSVYMARKEAIKEAGWGTSITEDFELTLKLYEKGYKIVFTPYVQAPAECVSTLKRLFRQRMRWAEGHSNNIKKMFKKLIQSPRLSFTEKLEFLYLSPYYLQATLFLVGNISWLIAELVFRVKLPFWTSIWGWSMVLTNLFALPLMNAVGLYIEESEKKDYSGILSFIALCYLVVPFQAYASIKGFLEKEEGTWFRTPKTGKITFSLAKSQFARLIKIFFPLRGKMAENTQTAENITASSQKEPGLTNILVSPSLKRLALTYAAPPLNRPAARFASRRRWIGKLSASLILTTSLLMGNIASLIPISANLSNELVFKNDHQKEGPSSKDLRLIPAKSDFRLNETPKFTLQVNKKTNDEDRFSLGPNKVSAANSPTDTNVEALVFYDGEQVDIPTAITQNESMNYEIALSPLHNFRPGRYTLQTTVLKNEAIYQSEQDFTWGVLAINTNKSVYKPGEKAKLAMAVLDTKGKMVCDAKLRLSIKSPALNEEKPGFRTLSTENGTIMVNPECQLKDLTFAPDYEAEYQVNVAGVYEMTLTAQTRNGTYTVNDSFEVRESIPYEIERITATRIYPPEWYPVTLKIKANQDIKGKVMEKVPHSFEIKTVNPKHQIANPKQIIWQVNWEKGKTYELAYEYKAPMESPQLYTLGPLRLVSLPSTSSGLAGQASFEEARKWQIAVDAKFNGIAWLAGTETTNSVNFNQTTAYDMEWSSAEYDSTYFSWSSGSNPERLTIGTAGDYLIGLNMPMFRDDGSTVRSRVEASIYVNGVKKDIGVARASYIRYYSGANEASNQLNFLLQGLAQNDYITVRVRSAPGNDMTGSSYSTEADGQVSFFAEYVSGSETVFAATGTQTTNSTNLNQATAYEMEWGAEVRKDSGYTHSTVTNPEDITLDSAGDYLVFVNIPVGDAAETVNDRNNLIGRVLIDSVEITGGSFANGYIRGDSNSGNGVDYDSSLHWGGVVTTDSANQVLSVSVEAEAGTDTMTVDGEKATIYVQELPSTNVYSGRATQVRTDSNDWDPATKAAIEWETDDIIDSSVYTHSTSTNPHQIEVEEPGDYLVVLNSSVTSSTQRSAQTYSIEVDGVEQTGAKTNTNYIRNANNHNTASSMMIYLLIGLVKNQIITTSVVEDGLSGTTDDLAPAKLMIWKKEASGADTAQLHFRWRDDTTDLNTSGGWRATEDSNSIGTMDRQETYRLRFEVANIGGGADPGRTYEVQWGEKTGSTCSEISTWTGLANSSDEFDMVATTHIDPDGESTTVGLLANDESYTRTNGEGRESADTTGSITLSTSYYAELEYSFEARTNATPGSTYCFRLYDTAGAGSELNYYVYPEVTISATKLPIGEYGTVSLTDENTTQVNLTNDYEDVIVVASARYSPTTDAQRAPRITAKANGASSSFTIKVDSSETTFSGSTTVDWIAMEAGAFTIPNGAGTTKVIAGSVNTNGTFCTNDVISGTPDVVTFTPNFDNPPAVLATVASNSDTDWTVTHIDDNTNVEYEPTVSTMRVMLNISFGTCSGSPHGAEDVDYIAFEEGHGTNNSVEFDAAISTDSINCCGNGDAIGFSETFSSAPEVAVVQQMGEDGGNGGYAIDYAGTSSTASTFYASIDEDGPSADRSHTEEIAAVIAFDASSGTIVTNISYNQAAYRWFENTDTTDVGSVLADQDTAATLTSDGQAFRLRALINVAAEDLHDSGGSFKLQFAQRSGTCDTSFSGESYADVTGSTAISYNDNSPADGVALTGNANDPDYTGTERGQTYEEANNFSNTESQIAVGENGMWDFALVDNTAPDDVSYCFRIVISDGTNLDTYTVIPEVTTVPENFWLLLGFLPIVWITIRKMKRSTTPIKAYSQQHPPQTL